jgi:hypothetical protein
MGLLFLIMGLSMFVGTLSTGLIFVGLLSLIFGLSMFVMALLADRMGAVKRAFLQGTGLFSLFMGLLLFAGSLLAGQILLSLVFLAIALGGAYLAYYPYKHTTNLVARPAAFKDVYYDEKRLYYDVRNKPYLFKWNEIKEYRILDVTKIDMNPNSLAALIALITTLPVSLSSSMLYIWLDPEYASTGIMKLGTVQFIKKDGSSTNLTHVLNPYRLVPILDNYIKGNS